MLLPQRWLVWEAFSLESALSTLQAGKRIPVVVCEANLEEGTWHDVVGQTSKLDRPPCVIVTSHLADEYLWAEALNIGAFDLLAKPFDAKEVMRVVEYATLRWTAQYPADARELVMPVSAER